MLGHSYHGHARDRYADDGLDCYMWEHGLVAMLFARVLSWQVLFPKLVKGSARAIERHKSRGAELGELACR